MTVGIFVTTFAGICCIHFHFFCCQSHFFIDNSRVSGCDGASGCSAAASWISFEASPRKLIGVAILLSGLFLSALLGHLQSLGYELFKKRDENEAMFYQHFFSVFFFAPLTSSLGERAAAWSAGPVFWSAGPVQLSWMWFNVLGNLVTQYICVRGVYLLVSTSGPVTTTLVLTVRKFVSLIISIVFFNNAWSFGHWIGTALVFGGAFVYSMDFAFFMPAKKEQ